MCGRESECFGESVIVLERVCVWEREAACGGESERVGE